MGRDKATMVVDGVPMAARVAAALAAGGCEQVVQGQLVRTAQGTPEAGEGVLLLQESLGDGWKGAAHKVDG